MAKLFGTDGIRGEAGRVLTVELAMKLGQAAGRVFLDANEAESATVVIGRDSRISGQMLEAALSAGLTSVGVQVISVGLLPTPAVAYLVRKYHAMAGAVISASHNPFEDNGIKFFNHTGHKLSDAQEAAIEVYLQSDAPIEGVNGDNIGRIVEDPVGILHYQDFLQQMITCQNTSYHLVIDCANGSASPIAETIFKEAGFKVTMISHQPDGVNINVACGSTHPERLQEMVRQEGADIGLAFDGDADRFLAVDEFGQLVDGDHLMAIYAIALKNENRLVNNQLVATVMSNLGLRIAMENAGIEIVETNVGDRYVNEALQATGAIIGGEQSGHIIFRDYNSTGDGLISAIMLLNIMCHTNKPLSTLAKEMMSLPQVLINVPVRQKEGWEEQTAIQQAIAEVNAALGRTGRVLVRASGTENLLRVMVEGEEQETINQMAENIADTVRNVIGK